MTVIFTLQFGYIKQVFSYKGISLPWAMWSLEVETRSSNKETKMAEKGDINSDPLW